MKTYSQFKREALRNRAVRTAYASLESEFDIIAALIRCRLEKGVTQKELAQRIGTKQSAIARLESGSYNPSIAFLNKVTRALGAKLLVTIGRVSS
ncbi:MAG: helix-turn-helix transcriptional regulator [Patescibacteria group bacterium]